MTKKKRKCKTQRSRLANNLLCLLNVLQECPATDAATCICRTLPPEKYQTARTKMEVASQAKS
jgi:hypothetical protein